METVPTARDLLAMIAYHDRRLFEVAAGVRLHPATLSRYLHGHRPLPPELALRVLKVIEALAKVRARDHRAAEPLADGAPFLRLQVEDEELLIDLLAEMLLAFDVQDLGDWLKEGDVMGSCAT